MWVCASRIFFLLQSYEVLPNFAIPRSSENFEASSENFEASSENFLGTKKNLVGGSQKMMKCAAVSPLPSAFFSAFRPPLSSSPFSTLLFRNRCPAARRRFLAPKRRSTETRRALCSASFRCFGVKCMFRSLPCGVVLIYKVCCGGKRRVCSASEARLAAAGRLEGAPLSLPLLAA